MNSMAINRRQSFALLAAAALCPSSVLANDGRQLYLSAATARDFRHGAALVDSDGGIVAKFELPARGHGAAVNKRSRHAVIFARRPGIFAVVIDISKRRPIQVIESQSDRHFYGHGCYSSDGRLLYATENDFEKERGVIGVYDAQDDYKRVAELNSYGIGPHEIILMPDRRTLAIANGGILTHPSAPRLKLNLDNMSPSLAMVNSLSGELVAKIETPTELNRLSIRHIAVNHKGSVAVAMQWEGSQYELPPLVCIWDQNSGLRLLSAPEDIQRRMRNYCGSVAFASDGTHFVVSAPRGDVLTHWRTDGTFRSVVPLQDVCAVAARDKSGFIAATGYGEIARFDDRSAKFSQLAKYDDIMWDNHMVAL